MKGHPLPQAHRVARREPDLLAEVLDEDPASLDQAARGLLARHVDLDQLAAYPDAEAEAVPFGGQSRVKPDVITV